MTKSDAPRRATFEAPSGARLRPALQQVPAYVAGRPAAPLEGVTTYKLSSNENPYPPLPSVSEAIARAALTRAIHKLPIKARIVTREEQF